jgi:hypothetical protein
MKLPVTDDALDDKDALTFLKGRAAVVAPFLCHDPHSSSGGAVPMLASGYLGRN